MSSYFDEMDTRIADLKEDDYHADGTTSAYRLEMEIVRDVTICAMLPGFPADLKRPIHETVLKYGIYTLPRNAEARDFETFDQHRELLRRLSSGLHSIFHAVGHSESPGFSDDPLSGLRDLYGQGEDEREVLIRPSSLPTSHTGWGRPRLFTPDEAGRYAAAIKAQHLCGATRQTARCGVAVCDTPDSHANDREPHRDGRHMVVWPLVADASVVLKWGSFGDDNHGPWLYSTADLRSVVGTQRKVTDWEVCAPGNGPGGQWILEGPRADAFRSQADVERVTRSAEVLAGAVGLSLTITGTPPFGDVQIELPAAEATTDPGELVRTEETARRSDISGYEDGDAERIEQAQEPSRLRAEIGRLRLAGKGGIDPLSRWCEVQWPPADMEYAPNPALSTATTDRADETVLLHATPSLRARIVALGYRPGETPAGMLPWLVGQAEIWRAALVDAEDRLEAAGLDEREP